MYQMLSELTDIFSKASWEALLLIGDFIISPMGQLLIWGMITTWTFVYLILRWITLPSDNVDLSYRVSASGIMVIVWCVNATLAVSEYLSLMIITDLLFTFLFLYLFLLMDRPVWLGWVCGLFILTVLIDCGYLSWVGPRWFAILVNVVYAAQLFIIVKQQKKSKDTCHFLPSMS